MSNTTVRGTVRRRPRVLSTAFLFVLSVYFLVPVWWLVVASTKSRSSLFGSDGFWFSEPQLMTNLDHLFSTGNGIFLRWMLNTVLYAGVGAAVATLLSGMAGYALAKYRFRGREAVFSVILGAVLVPAPLLALPIYLMFSKVHLTDTVWAVLLPSMVSPFGVYLSRIYAVSAVPEELLEAARIDGSSEWRTFRTVVLPIMSPALVTVFLFQFTAIWNNFFLPLVTLGNQKLWPVNLGLYYWDSLKENTPYDLVVTGALVSVVPLAAAFLLLQRYWRTDLVAGGVKA